MSVPKKPKTTATFRTRMGVEGRVTVPFKVREAMALFLGQKVEVTVRVLGPEPAPAAPPSPVNVTSTGDASTMAVTGQSAYTVPTSPSVDVTSGSTGQHPSYPVLPAA